MSQIVIIGAGFAGLGMGIKLKEAGHHDFVILEKASDLGGTWWENTYPGCACDVPSPMYSFSFELNRNWTELFAPQPEIQRYLAHCAEKYDVKKHIRFDSHVEAVEYDDAAARWNVALGDGEVLRPRAVVSGVGALHVPNFPEVPGLETFQGKAFHSAEWDHSYDLSGKRVAVIGTGASAIQFVPQIAKKAARTTVFQRTPAWIQSKPNIKLPAAFKLPGVPRAVRNVVYWVLEARAVGFALDPRLSGPMKWMATSHLKRQVKDPELRRKLTPDYTIGCKRVLLSNDYYPAMARDDVDLVTDGIAEVRANSVVTRDGREIEVDAIVFGTGFKVVDAMDSWVITGRNGQKIQQAWENGIEAHHGTTLPGFPNFFMLLGPNTGLGHNSVVFMIETQVAHILSLLKLLSETGATTVEPKPEALRAYNDKLHKRLRRAVWNEGGCDSWYLDKDGVNRTIWPGFTFEFWSDSRKARREDYILR
ncbi:cation diffusion facilitator CzcD-associated flavoprotein CzcO [Actinocorallia herbida]|uniref:Cation diffusion facilitator CzcD-associated flavoprotein CzcO n=1 Tax=Actinocorallia herbida TaxID=58109 RepID=A0A3N1D9K6_9ACTN|nr:NAD(P)/FAD-dependent oxidoreductase [Actinocorallia herbida]ROO89768.1 cation diffusion facilitator CzcD-associated flavoprotein CzcO [Actinocorallia herbida]